MHTKCTRTDFLASIADNTFLFRDGIVPTEAFINSATQQVQVVFVFFTPRSGLVTVLNINVDFSRDEILKVRSRG